MNTIKYGDILKELLNKHIEDKNIKIEFYDIIGSLLFDTIDIEYKENKIYNKNKIIFPNETDDAIILNKYKVFIDNKLFIEVDLENNIEIPINSIFTIETQNLEIKL